MRLRLLAAIAVALAIVPASAAEPDTNCPRDDQERVEPPPRDASIIRVGPALDGLQRLRLHPARDGFDVTEAARRHPPTNGD